LCFVAGGGRRTLLAVAADESPPGAVMITAVGDPVMEINVTVDEGLVTNNIMWPVDDPVAATFLEEPVTVVTENSVAGSDGLVVNDSIISLVPITDAVIIPANTINSKYIFIDSILLPTSMSCADSCPQEMSSSAERE